ncbi:MFS transporter [Ponticoccus sp. SC2-23]|uniref:MFS transporter n=1 Tax=Alexandriicola marinus TaxID=2081710 RepID=UPI000FDA01C0|nr:MFS transporter [Alexandriicola marinus]MBM1221524.1 MFS transporter [Ponticoccus sp. SC6-9]MBM1226565.1 MFS transporter [Ponticoccus sp. SC6-15]MBM1230516.1 MFS transporter [Ponticoccus sp. SC6-38]MBM1235039.1 MFS transporter [Ponticoccus sp. SC6-45]MBM1239537.1 MFS transporter [Ponticoccus sp. SC6-49]MBM1243319.1 MFS transporter [Ponticoccus sp. SC2-64]MBM1248563.1 MFS transporter [Ponticoccus sp. SC6-42]MBM1253148.1 MFS transporter [Ponticoccus sp. SC6-33]MBM1257546.1 MFS transporter
MRIVSLSEAQSLPYWRRPVMLLFLMAIAMPVSFATWSALLNNFVIEVADFDGSDIGWLHTVREVPGFLAVGVLALLMFMREQVLGLVALVLLGVATGVTAWFPSLGGILVVTMLSSIGFHYFETVNQSLQLQWMTKERAPQMLGWLLSAGSAATLVAYILIVVTWETFDLSYNFVYLVSGGFTIGLAIYCIVGFPQFEAPHVQLKSIVLRRRYWLYYMLQFMSGARRQIFVVFAGFMMVEKFGFEVHEVTALYLINLIANMIFAPLMGRLVTVFGERRALIFEYGGLVIVFLAYGGLYWFGWGVLIASILYVVDHIFFALALAMKTYFQKIADPGDIAPTAAVAFTINHIAAVFLPALLGYLWLVSPPAVFVLAAGMALASLVLALLIPRHPAPGNETILSRVMPTALGATPGE